MGLVQSHDEYGKEGIPIFRVIGDFSKNANISFISIERMLSNPVNECSSVVFFGGGVGAGVGSVVYS